MYHSLPKYIVNLSFLHFLNKLYFIFHIMKKSEIFRFAIIDSFGTALYIIFISTFMFYASEGFFGKTETIFIPIVMLMLLVLSAAITGSLILGKPILLYIDGKKREALTLLFYTLGVFLILTIIMIFILILINNI